MPFFQRKSVSGSASNSMSKSTSKSSSNHAPDFSFQLHITDACDQRCKHCYIYAEDPGKKPQQMTWEQIQTAVSRCVHFSLSGGYRPFFFITGGDPILHPDFWQLVTLLHSLDIPFVILGNPYHLDVKNCRKLKKLGCDRYQVSLDGLEATHDMLRRPGSFQDTLNSIRIMKKAGLRSIIMTTVSSLNINEMLELTDVVVASGADIWSFARYCPTSAFSKDKECGSQELPNCTTEFSDGPINSAMTPQAYREMLVKVGEKIRGHLAAGCKTWFDKKEHLWTLLDYEQGRFVIPEDARRGVIYGGCHCGISHLTILPNGDVLACRRVPNSKVGNIFTDSLSEMWVMGLKPYRQYERFERCSECALLSWCRGCPAVAASTNGNYFSPDPQCWRIVEN